MTEQQERNARIKWLQGLIAGMALNNPARRAVEEELWLLLDAEYGRGSMSDWPNAERLGAPLNPDREGYHWLLPIPEIEDNTPHIGDNATPHPQLWGADEQGWIVGGEVWSAEKMARTETYICPCPWPGA